MIGPTPDDITAINILACEGSFIIIQLVTMFITVIAETDAHSSFRFVTSMSARYADSVSIIHCCSLSDLIIDV